MHGESEETRVDQNLPPEAGFGSDCTQQPFFAGDDDVVVTVASPAQQGLWAAGISSVAAPSLSGDADEEERSRKVLRGLRSPASEPDAGGLQMPLPLPLPLPLLQTPLPLAVEDNASFDHLGGLVATQAPTPMLQTDPARPQMDTSHTHREEPMSVPAAGAGAPSTSAKKRKRAPKKSTRPRPRPRPRNVEAF